MLRMFSRYAGVQVLAYSIDMGSFLALSRLAGMDALPANVVAKLLAGGFAFVVHRRVTFAVAGKGSAPGQLVRYAALLALNVPVASAFLALLLPWLSPPALAKFTADVICVLLTFFASRYLVFAPARDRDGPP